MPRTTPTRLIASLVLATLTTAARAQPAFQPVSESTDSPDTDNALHPVELKLTIEPSVAKSIAHQYRESLKQRYELSDQQADHIESALARRLLAEAPHHKELIQTLMNATVVSMLTRQGQWSPDVAKDFGRRIQPQLPAMRKALGYFVDDIRGELTAGQKLRFAADFAAFSVGYASFEQRMKKWSDGKVGDNPGLFWEDQSEELPTTRPDGTVESKEMAAARRDAAQMVKWQLCRTDFWKTYADNAAAYYRFTDAQKSAAQAILKECLERAKPFQTAERTRELEQNDLVQQLTYTTDDPTIQNGPFMTSLRDRSAELARPLDNLDAEFKLRIRELAFAEQIAAAENRAYEKLEKKGYRKPATP